MARTQQQRHNLYAEAEAAINAGTSHLSSWAPDEDLNAVVNEARSYLSGRNINAGFGMSVDEGWTVLRIQGG